MELVGVPDKCRVVGRLVRGGKAGPTVTIVKYPRACHLICLRVGARGDSETQGASGGVSGGASVGASGEASVVASGGPSTSTDAGAGGSSGEVVTPSQRTGKGRAMHGQRMVEWLEVGFAIVNEVFGGGREETYLFYLYFFSRVPGSCGTVIFSLCFMYFRCHAGIIWRYLAWWNPVLQQRSSM